MFSGLLYEIDVVATFRWVLPSFDVAAPPRDKVDCREGVRAGVAIAKSTMGNREEEGITDVGPAFFPQMRPPIPAPRGCR
eukprot:scaffold173319_cov31-Tisochrysis_lutea.AAC.2